MFQVSGFRAMSKRSTLILIILAIIFSGIYFWLATPLKTDFLISPRFDWPDETSNYFWIKHYAQTGELSIFEPLNSIAENQIHPRSFNVKKDGSLVPGSFLGLILFYGSLARILGTNSIIYFTPIFAIFGVLAFSGIIKRIFNPKIALISAILLLFNPAWWYYSVTSMLPNVPFISLVLLSIYFLFKADKLKLSHVLISSFSIGLAVMIRPAEIIWLAVVYLTVLIYLRKKIKISQVVIFLVVSFLIVLPMIYQQQFLFGDFLSSGYSQLQQTQNSSCQFCGLIKSLVSPFGFHPYLVAVNLWNHYFIRLWWLSLLAVLGLLAFLLQPTRQRDEIFGYIFLSLFLFAWLGVYYGSWQFTDLLTMTINTLGVSYVRYWLPLYILALPFVAIALIWLSSFFKNRWSNLALTVLLIILFYQSANLVLVSKPDSILPVRERIVTYKEIASEVNQLTEPQSVIVAVRKDKVFFPERKVIHTFDALSLNKELLPILPDLIKAAPVYYYALGPEPNLRLDDNLKLEVVKSIGQEVLYRIISN